MSEMVERVAKAIAASFAAPDDLWEKWIPQARAAIEAMRVPTEAIYLARPIIIPDRSDWDVIWRGTIDAALDAASAPTRHTGRG